MVIKLFHGFSKPSLPITISPLALFKKEADFMVRVQKVFGRYDESGPFITHHLIFDIRFD